MNQQIPDFIKERIRTPCRSKYIVPLSTPVPFFGNYVSAKVYTIGINPSHLEFLTDGNKILPDSNKRLSDFETLGLTKDSSLEDLDEFQVGSVVGDCLTYFKRRPYKWFNSLERVVNNSLNVSYFSDTACHLDLVQWATIPVWGKIREEDPSEASQLLHLDLPFLEKQLDHLKSQNKGIKCIFLSGRTVVENLQSLMSISLVGKTKVNHKRYQYDLFSGEFKGILVLGSSMNVPDSRTSQEHRKYLGGWIDDQVGSRNEKS